MRDTPYAQLAHYARYLKAAVARIDKLRADPARDSQADGRDGARCSRNTSVPAPRSRARPIRRLDEFRWLLEELRVALFAQELRTPMPVSVKRLHEVLGIDAALSRLCRQGRYLRDRPCRRPLLLPSLRLEAFIGVQAMLANLSCFQEQIMSDYVPKADAFRSRRGWSGGPPWIPPPAAERGWAAPWRITWRRSSRKWNAAGICTWSFPPTSPNAGKAPASRRLQIHTKVPTSSTSRPHLTALYSGRFQALKRLRAWSRRQWACVGRLIAPVLSPSSLGELAADITTLPNHALKDSAQRQRSGAPRRRTE